MIKREEEARKAIDTLDGTIKKVEDYRSTAEKDIANLFASIHTSVDARHAQVLQQMQDKGNQLRKTAIQEKGEAESATVQFREFHSFNEGLLAQGTPLEIAGTHKMVSDLSVFVRWCGWADLQHFPNLFFVFVIEPGANQKRDPGKTPVSQAGLNRPGVQVLPRQCG